MAMRKTILCSILLAIAVFMLVSFIGIAKASGNVIFVIGPKQEAVEHVNLWGSGRASGNLSVSSGQIDFFVRDPDGIIVQEFLNISTTSFSFVADKNGNYSLCMDNIYEAFNVTVELNYGVELTFYGSSTIGISTSASMSTQISPTFVRPHPLNLEDDEGSDYVITPYRIFQGATQMLEAINSGGVFLPFRGVNLTRCTIASPMVLLGFASIGLAVCKRRFNLRQIKCLTN